MNARASRIDAFWSRVTVGPGCWEHSGSVGSHGYPQATHPSTGKSVPAHQVGWLVQSGYEARPMFVLHECNNKKCVRAGHGHLYLGDHVKNMDDMAKAGHPRRKLSDADVRRIRSSRLPQRQLAACLGVSQRSISNVQKFVTYRYERPEVAPEEEP